MIKLVYFVPLIMCGLWFWYLKSHNWTIRQGWKGFAYIIAFNIAIAVMLTVLIQLTQG